MMSRNIGTTGRSTPRLATTWYALATYCLAVSFCVTFAAHGQDTNRTASSPRVEAWFVQKLWTGHGPAIEGGVLVVSDGKIQAIGREQDTPVPAGAIRHELRDCHLVPGLILAETSLAGSEDDEQAITPYFRAIDAFDFFGDYSDLLSQGVTTVQIAPGAARLIPGQAAVVKLAGADIATRTLRESESLRILLTSAAFSPPTVYEPPIGAVSEARPLEPTRPQLASSLAGAAAGLRVLFRSANEPLANDLSPQDREILSTLNQVSSGDLPVRITALSASEIRVAAQLARELKLRPILVKPEQLEAVVDDLPGDQSPFRGFVLPLAAGVDRIANRPVASPDASEAKSVWELAKQLRDQQRWPDVAVSLSSRQDISQIWFAAGLLKRGGLSTEEILAMLTDNAARLMGVADRVGSLQVGKDADFVLLSGRPWERGAQVLETVVAGESAWKKSATTSAATARVIRAGSIYSDHGPWEGAEIAVQGGTIVGVGPDVTLPANAVVDEFPGAVVVPGMLDLNTTLAFGGALNNTFPLNTKLSELLVSQDSAVETVRRSGVTTVLAAPTRLPGPVIAYKLTDRPTVIRDPVALKFEVTGNLTQAGTTLRSTLTRGQEYFEQWQRYDAAMVEYNQALKVYEKKLAEYEAAKAKQEQEKQAAEKAAAEKAAAEKSGGEKPAGDGGTGESGAGSNSGPATPGTPSRGSTGGPGTPPAETGRPRDPVGPAPSTGSQNPSPGTPATPAPAGQSGPDAAKSVAGNSGDGKQENQADTPELKAPEKPTEPRKPNEVPAMEPCRELFAGKIPAMVEAQQFNAIELAVKIFADEFKLNTIITGATDLIESSKVLQHPKVSVVVGPTLFAGRPDSPVNLAQWLATQRIAFGFRSNGETGSGELPLAIEYATYQGLGVSDAIRGLTTHPASFLGLSGIGSVAVGRDADLVVLSGPPFELGTEVLAVMINGQWVYKKESR